MNIEKREAQILRIKAASFHPQMSEALENKIRANVISTAQNTIEVALIEEMLAAREKMLTFPRRSGYYSRLLNTQYGQIDLCG